MKVIRLTALGTGRQETSLVLIAVKSMSLPQDHSAVEGIKSIKNFNDPVGNRTYDLPAFSAVPKTTAPPQTNTNHRKKS
jgi:hypothetical protein